MAKLNPSILEYSVQHKSKTNIGCIEFPHTVPWLKCYSDLYTVSSIYILRLWMNLCECINVFMIL